MPTWFGAKPASRTWRRRGVSPKASKQNFRTSCWPIIARPRLTGRRSSTAPASASFSANSAPWATNFSSLRSLVFTHSITACSPSRTATRSVACRRILNCRKPSSRPRRMVTRRRNISVKWGPVTSMTSPRSSPAAKAPPPRCMAPPNRNSSTDGKRRGLHSARRFMNKSEIAPAAATLTDSRLASLCAQTAHHAFLDYQKRFHAITGRARARFLARDWTGAFADAAERLHLYGAVMDDLRRESGSLMEERLSERSVWRAIKAVYSSLIAQSRAWEIAESFFNSLTRRVFATEGVDQAIEFVDTDFDAPPNQSLGEVSRVHSGAALPDLLFAAVTDLEAGGFAEECWTDLRRAAALAAERIEGALPKTNTEGAVSL